jgi:hypothetical protein
MRTFLYTFGFESPRQARNNARSLYWDDEDSQRVLIDADDEAAALAWGHEISERFMKLLYRDDSVSWGDRYANGVETPGEDTSDVQHVRVGEYPNFEPWLEGYEDEASEVVPAPHHSIRHRLPIWCATAGLVVIFAGIVLFAWTWAHRPVGFVSSRIDPPEDWQFVPWAFRRFLTASLLLLGIGTALLVPLLRSRRRSPTVGPIRVQNAPKDVR